MIESTTYFTCVCDSCRTTLGKSHPTEAEQMAALEEAKWMVFWKRRRCFCAKCCATYERIMDEIKEAVDAVP